MNSKPEPQPLDEIMAEYDAELLDKEKHPEKWADIECTTVAGNLGEMLDEDDAKRLAEYREEQAKD